MGAAGLAAATIVSGLSFGAPAASATAAPEPSSAETQASDRLIGKFVQLNRTGSTDPRAFVGVAAPTLNAAPGRVWSQSKATAQSSAGTYTFPAAGNRGPIRGTGSAADLCLQPSSLSVGSVVLGRACTGAANQDWEWTNVYNQFVSGPGLRPVGSTYTIGASDPGDSGFMSITHLTAEHYADAVLRGDLADATAALSATVTSVDYSAKSAVLSGTATPGATVTIGSQSVTVASDGTWSMTVSGARERDEHADRDPEDQQRRARPQGRHGQPGRGRHARRRRPGPIEARPRYDHGRADGGAEQRGT